MTPLPEGPFGAILADPPWNFVTYSGESAVPTQASDPYQTMTLDELRALPVSSVAAPNCALFMWASGTHFDQAIDLGKAWGFRFIRGEVLVWVKAREHFRPNLGMGYWTRNGGEIAMLFARGKPKPLAHDVEQLIFCPRGAHSEKPAEQYERIERLVAGPYLELFSRASQPGWTAWGNEAGSRDGLFAGVAA